MEHLFPQLFPFPLLSFSFFQIHLCFDDADEAPEQPCSSFLCIEGDALALEAKLSSRDADSPPRDSDVHHSSVRGLGLGTRGQAPWHLTPSVPQH